MRVTTKGQVTIPLEIRQKLNITPASEVEFVLKDDERVYIVKKKSRPLRAVLPNCVALPPSGCPPKRLWR
jgi:AbrB family looped-hinge helix DNA binding protein